MKKEALERLERQLSKGKFHFILMWGVIFWGIPVAIATKLGIHFLGGQLFFSGLASWLIWLATWSIFGIFYGMWLWSVQNKKYKKAKSEQ